MRGGVLRRAGVLPYQDFGIFFGCLRSSSFSTTFVSLARHRNTTTDSSFRSESSQLDSDMTWITETDRIEYRHSYQRSVQTQSSRNLKSATSPPLTACTVCVHGGGSGWRSGPSLRTTQTSSAHPSLCWRSAPWHTTHLIAHHVLQVPPWPWRPPRAAEPRRVGPGEVAAAAAVEVRIPTVSWRRWPKVAHRRGFGRVVRLGRRDARFRAGQRWDALVGVRRRREKERVTHWPRGQSGPSGQKPVRYS